MRIAAQFSSMVSRYPDGHPLHMIDLETNDLLDIADALEDGTLPPVRAAALIRIKTDVIWDEACMIHYKGEEEGDAR